MLRTDINAINNDPIVRKKHNFNISVFVGFIGKITY